MLVSKSIQDAVKARVRVGKEDREDVQLLREGVVLVEDHHEGVRGPANSKYNKDQAQGPDQFHRFSLFLQG